MVKRTTFQGKAVTKSNLKIIMNFKIHNQLKKYIISSINKSIIWAFLGVLLFKITLDLSYYFIISPIFEYMRFSLNLNVIKLIESYFLFTVIFILMPKSSKKLSPPAEVSLLISLMRITP